jgi:transcriptional regulator with XRE-family HTH domain
MAANGTLADLLERELRRRGWTLAYFADLLGRLGGPTVSPSVQVVWNWRSGRVLPGPTYRRLIARALDLPVEAIVNAIALQQAVKAGVDGDTQGDVMGPPLLPSLLASVDPDRLAYTGPVDSRYLDGLSALTRSYLQLHNTVPPAAVRNAITDHFEELTALALRSHPPSTAQRIRTLAGQAAVLAGWVSFNLQSIGQALAYWVTAHDLARDAGNVGLQAHALGCRSRLYSPIHRRRHADRVTALALLEVANSLADRAASPALRSWLLANRAQQLAATARPEDSYRDLESASRLVAMPGPTNDDVLSGWDEVRVDAYRGICAMALRRPAEVIVLLEPVLARTDPARVQRTLQQSDLAAAYAQQGEIERACSLLGEGLSATGEAQFPEGVQRALGVRARQLERWAGSRAVRELDDLILAAGYTV